MTLMTRIPLHWQILGAIVLAVLVGMNMAPGDTLYAVCNFVGTLFLNALRMVVVPLVCASIICGIIGISGRDLGRLGSKTLLFYLLTSSLAITVGLTVINLFNPGLVDGQPIADQLGLALNTEQTQMDLARVEGRDFGDIVEVLLRMVPPNIVSAAASGQMLGLIFFSLLFAFFAARIEGEPGKVIRAFWQAIFDIMMRITMLVMRFAPLGVFGLVARTISMTGVSALISLFWFALAVTVALAIHMLVIQPLLLMLVGRVKPGRHFQAMAPALLTAFSTASSSATLPVTMKCVRDRAGVSERTSGFVLPLGSTVNMDGTALYECAAALFIAQAYGVDLGFGGQFIIVLTALLTSIGAAGIPSASLSMMVIILSAVGLPLEGIGLLLAVDRVLDMMRTAINVFGDSCGAVIIARSEGEEKVLADEPGQASP